MNSCKHCLNRKQLHVADRITLGGNKTYHSHRELGLLAESRGLISGSLSKLSKLVIINPSGAKLSDYRSARMLGVKIVTPDEFVKIMGKICRGNLTEKRNPLFSTRLGTGKRIYPLGLSKDQEKMLKDRIKGSGSILAIQRKPSLSAVVTTSKLLHSGRADVFRVWGVPIYVLERIAK